MGSITPTPKKPRGSRKAKRVGKKLKTLKMKYFSILLLLAFASCGKCDMRDSRQRASDAIKEHVLTDAEKNEMDSAKNWWRSVYNVVEMDGCEYIVYQVGGNRGMMTHKGNCKNPIHIYAK